MSSEETMKILFVHKNCLFGGVETFMAALAPLLRSYGHACEFFFFNHGPMEHHLPEGCPAHFGELADCIKLVRSERFDIVHVNSLDWMLGLSAVRSAGAKLIVMAQGMVVPGWTSANCDAFVACAKWHAEEQSIYTDLPIQVVYNGIDESVFKPNPEAAASAPPIVAWVGRGVDGAKQIEKFAAVAPLLKRAGLRVWLAEPHGVEEVEKIVPGVRESLLPHVDFWGSVPREDMPRFFQEVAASGGCVVSTSKSAGLPLALIEAQACACPVVGSDVRGINECVDPDHGGVLYPFAIAPEDLAGLIVGVVQDKAQLARRREACVRYVNERFTMGRIAREYERVYREALQSRRKYWSGLRTRLRLAPLLYWRDYVAHRWGPGQCQYEASRRLAARGEWSLASMTVRASVLTSPTIFLRPERMAYFVKTHLRMRP
jgi:glycosyltransferase involved in cell wall biosynthesis